jgi:hypothetical protein
MRIVLLIEIVVMDLTAREILRFFHRFTVIIHATKEWKLVGNHHPRNLFVITLLIAMVGEILLVVKEIGVFAMQTIVGVARF